MNSVKQQISLSDVSQPLNQSLSNSLFDTIVVGSGPGGATVAKELSLRGQKVAVVEWGSDAPLEGKFLQMAGIAAIPGKGAFINSDLSLLMRGITAGGSSTINFATAMAPPADLFSKYGVDLSVEVAEVEQELPLTTLTDDLVGPLAKQIKSSALSMGLDWRNLQKFTYLDKCRAHCHRCAYGCPYDAKWNARMYLDQAIESGAKLFLKAKVSQVLTEKDRAVGIKFTQQGRVKQLRANNIVLAAGGIGTPRILAASGVARAGKDYFTDPVIAVMGTVDGADFDADKSDSEVPMAAGMHLPEQGIMLSDLALPKPLFQLFSAQVGRFDRLHSHARTLSIMVKIRDDLGGNVGPKWLNKSLSADDKSRFETGVDIAKNILRNANAKSIFKSHHFAAHPGGSAKIGEVVDSDLQTNIPGLFVCDASVIPEPWGLPPTYTLLCLGKRLAKTIVR
ncbi:GMC family oxidoreductase N-terminal domain-containing protein [Amphritea sp. HPY]|uniref:GMC family oxidoreductase N-terminal domain-containing protein n=1 Tax=Amphritea sp. HPY TaxID=3421652 RepID=UPI003D7E41E0